MREKTEPNNAEAVAEFWAAARRALPELPPAVPNAWAFGATAELSDELLQLVLRGIKTATSSAYDEYQLAGEPLPVPGQLDIVLDGSGSPGALIEIVGVSVLPFHGVTEDIAATEGEGDRTLAYWRNTHQRFWEQHLSEGLSFSTDMPVVVERFRLRYPLS